MEWYSEDIRWCWWESRWASGEPFAGVSSDEEVEVGDTRQRQHSRRRVGRDLIEELTQLVVHQLALAATQ
jgi:hypothetical protein